KNVPFTVTGILMPKGLSTQGVDQDDVVIMPYTSAMKRVIGGTTLRNINVQISDARQILAAQQQIIALLRQRHNLRARRDDSWNWSSPISRLAFSVADPHFYQFDRDCVPV